jgi:predicted secreted acid phosphatase
VIRSLSRRAAPVVAPLAALALVAAPAGAATTRTAATPTELRAGHAAYDKALTAGYAKATKKLDALLEKDPKKPTVVLDIDETALSNWGCFDAVDFDLGGLATCAIDGKAKAIPAARTFVKHARAKKVKVAFITGSPQVICATRKKNLIAQGFPSAFTITCKPATYTQDSAAPYKAAARKALVQKGATILFNIGDQKSDLSGGSAKATVLLPNPIYVTS